jgi:hypothetical protein
MNTITDHGATLILKSNPSVPVSVDPEPHPYGVVRFNAMKHGILSRYTVLSHESHADYEDLVNSLIEEHQPTGPTEQHLVEELACVIWRKRRVLQAEGATINKGLKDSSRNAKSIIPAAAPFEVGLSGENTRISDLMDLRPEDVAASQQSTRHDMDATSTASVILRTTMRWCRSACRTLGASWVFYTNFWRRKSVSQNWTYYQAGKKIVRGNHECRRANRARTCSIHAGSVAGRFPPLPQGCRLQEPA